MKLTNCIILVFFVVSFSGCGSDDDGDAVVPVEPKPDPLKIGIIDASFSKIKFKDYWSITHLAEQPDGKILITGQFVFDEDTYDGNNRSSIARINPDGSRDKGFKDAPHSTVWYGTRLAIQSDGKILMSYITRSSFGGVITPRIMRLNTDGTEDETFKARNLDFLKRYGHDGTSASVHRNISDIVVLPDGKILLSGNFDTIGQTLYPYIVRLHPDGSVDNTFTFNSLVNFYSGRTFGHVGAMIPKDNKIMIGGLFVKENGDHDIGYSLARLDNNGKVDETVYDQYVQDPDCKNKDVFGRISCMAILPDGKIIIGGAFSTVETSDKKFIARLQANGQLDPSFSTSLPCDDLATITNITVLPDGKIFIGWKSEGMVLNADGSTFETISGLENKSIQGALMTSKGLVIVGNFSTFNNFPAQAIVRITL
jgi:uncharacterized delta-60 repeat protein